MHEWGAYDCQYSGLWAAILYTQLSYDLRHSRVGCLLAHLLGGTDTVGRGISWLHGGFHLFMSSAAGCWLRPRKQWCVMGRPPSKSMLSWSLFVKRFCAHPVLPPPPPPNCVTPETGSNQVTRPWHMKLCKRLGTSRRRGSRWYNKVVGGGRVAQPGDGEMVYWFHLRAHLPEQARWPTFVQRQPASCYMIDLPTAEAARDLRHCHR